jgi:hypothetical protein
VRRAALGLLALLLLAGAFLAWARLFHAGELGPIPGGALSGEPASELPADWSFANQDPYLRVESRAFALPWSGDVWFLAHEGRLHLLLPGFFGDGLVRRLERDPRVRVEVEGRVYEQVAVAVTDDADLAALMAPVLRRQFAIEIEGALRRVPGTTQAPLAIYRLEDPGSPSSP